MNNKELLSKTTSDMYERQNRLHIGQAVRIGDSESGEGREHINKRKKGTIVGLHKHFMVVQFKSGKEDFTYIDIVTSITNYADRKDRGGERFFSAKFGKEYKRITIEMIPFKINLENQILIPKKERKNKNKKIYRKWSSEKIKYIMENKDSMLRQDLTDDFNLKFGTKVTRPQINAAIHREKEKI